MGNQDGEYGEKAYRDEDVLRELYVERGLSQVEIGSMFGVYSSTISRWLDKHDIETVPPIEDRFKSKYEVNEDTGCWEWTAATDKDGYGVFTEDGEYIRAHRYSYKVHNDSNPGENMVLHKCHNRPCVNPDHLYTGDGEDNMQDAIKNGTFPDADGLRKGRKKLEKSDVITIRQRYQSEDITQTDLANEYGVSLATVCDLLHARTWADVCGPTIT